MKNALAKKKCIPCEGGVAPLSPKEAKIYIPHVKGWKLDAKGKEISRTFTFKNFVKAMAFVSAVAKIAEKENHHPDIHIFYNKVTLDLSTHAIKGLSENDFILAAKVDGIIL